VVVRCTGSVENGKGQARDYYRPVVGWCGQLLLVRRCKVFGGAFN